MVLFEIYLILIYIFLNIFYKYYFFDYFLACPNHLFFAMTFYKRVELEKAVWERRTRRSSAGWGEAARDGEKQCRARRNSAGWGEAARGREKQRRTGRSSVGQGEAAWCVTQRSADSMELKGNLRLLVLV